MSAKPQYVVPSMPVCMCTLNFLGLLILVFRVRVLSMNLGNLDVLAQDVSAVPRSAAFLICSELRCFSKSLRAGARTKTGTIVDCFSFPNVSQPHFQVLVLVDFLYFLLLYFPISWN